MADLDLGNRSQPDRNSNTSSEERAQERLPTERQPDRTSFSGSRHHEYEDLDFMNSRRRSAVIRTQLLRILTSSNLNR
jgi:hypothetical protein